MTIEEKKRLAEEAAQKAEEGKKAAEAKKTEGEDEDKKEEFAKDKEQVDANRYNQALRKAREAEAEKRELEKELAKARKAQAGRKIIQVPAQKKEEEDEEEDDFWGQPKQKEAEQKQQPAAEDIEQIINEKIRPFVESETERKKLEKRKARESFYQRHPEYLDNADKWAELLDELNGSIVPSSDYYQDLEKAHRIIGGEDFNQMQIEQKKKEIANQAGAGDGGGNPPAADISLSEMDKKIMEGTGVSKEVIEKMHQMEKEGRLSLEF